MRLLYDVMGSRSAFMLSSALQHNSRIQRRRRRRRRRSSSITPGSGRTLRRTPGWCCWSIRLATAGKSGAAAAAGHWQRGTATDETIGSKQRARSEQKERVKGARRGRIQERQRDWPILTQPCREALATICQTAMHWQQHFCTTGFLNLV